jgi:hypothetical protein
MTRRNLALLLAAASTLAVSAALVHRGETHASNPPSSSPPASPTRAACSLSPGDAASFSITRASVTTIDTTALVAQGITSGNARQAIGARVEARVDVLAIGNDGDAAVVAVRVRDHRQTVDQGPTQTVDVSAPMLVKIRPTCEIAAYAHPAEVSADAARVAETIVATLDVAVRPGAAYAARFRDGRGELEARHVPTPGGVERTVTRAAQVFRAGAGAVAEVVSSAGRAEMGPGSFVGRVIETDTLRVRRADGVVTEQRQEIRAERIASSGEAFAGVALEPSRFVCGDHLADEPLPPPPAPEARRAGVTLDAAMAEITARMAQKNGGIATARYLTEALRGTPTLAAKLADAIASKAVTREARAFVMLALARADVAEARAALRSLAEGRRAGEAERMEAVMHLASARGAGRPEADALRKLSTDADAGVASTAVLAMGTLAQATGERDAGLSRALRNELGERLRGESDATTRAVLASAAANTGDGTFVPAIDALTTSADPRLRASALSALDRLPGTSAAVAAHLADESDPDVRRLVLGQLARAGGQPDPGLVALALQQMPTERDVGTQRALAEILGRAGTPEAHDALLALYRVTTDASLRQRLGSFLSAADLPAVR